MPWTPTDGDRVRTVRCDYVPLTPYVTRHFYGTVINIFAQEKYLRVKTIEGHVINGPQREFELVSERAFNTALAAYSLGVEP